MLYPKMTVFQTIEDLSLPYSLASRVTGEFSVSTLRFLFLWYLKAWSACPLPTWSLKDHSASNGVLSTFLSCPPPLERSCLVGDLSQLSDLSLQHIAHELGKDLS